ncbi:hypothetical protein D3C71_1821590 [compost metagenome]
MILGAAERFPEFGGLEPVRRNESSRQNGFFMIAENDPFQLSTQAYQIFNRMLVKGNILPAQSFLEFQRQSRRAIRAD